MARSLVTEIKKDNITNLSKMPVLKGTANLEEDIPVAIVVDLSNTTSNFKKEKTQLEMNL